jgi:hypothetical protein
MTNDAQAIHSWLVERQATSPTMAITRRMLMNSMDSVIGDRCDWVTCGRFYSAWRSLLRAGVAHDDGKCVWASR